MNLPIGFAIATTLLLLGGCSSKTAPAASAWNKYDLGGGRYIVEIEVTQPFSSSLDFRFHDQGNTQLQEFVELSIGETTKLRIDNGQLTINGSERGEVNHGDRIKVYASGQVSVNNVDR